MSTTPVSVHYDISVLGLGHEIERSRTGIFKVIEELAMALEARDDIQLQLLSQLDEECICRCHRYLEEAHKLNSPYLSETSIPLISCQDIERGAMSKIVMDARKGRTVSLLWRAGYCISRFRNKGIQAWKNNRARSRNCRRMLINKKDMSIYHATHQPIPAVISRMRDIVPFATSYDMIPLLYPVYCTDYDIGFTREMVNSIPLHGHVITISECSKQDFLAFRQDFDPKNVHVAYPAASEIFHPYAEEDQIMSLKRQLGMAYDDTYYLSVCTLEPRKNLDSVIEAYGKVASQLGIDTPYLVLAGAPGWKYGSIHEKLDRLNVHKHRVLLAGYVADDDLPTLYAGATCFLFPSLYEGFGLPPLEAMKCGTPVICSNTSSLPEVVGEAGILIDPMDCEVLSQAMLAMTCDPELRNIYSIKSVERSRLFTWGRMADTVTRAYNYAIQ